MDEIVLAEGLSKTAGSSGYQAKLRRLLERQVWLYTFGESSSVTEETALKLLDSIVFCLDFYHRKSGYDPAENPEEDLNAVFDRALKAVQQQTGRGRQLYELAVKTAVPLENISYIDTLKGMNLFFRKYDCRFGAQCIPCDIDYQLCMPVAEDLLGIDYICAYLRRLILENTFLARFEQDRLFCLLEKSCPGYRQLPVNLYEPAAVNALGLALIGGQARKLEVTLDEQKKIAEKFALLSDAPAKKALLDASSALCATLGVTDAPSAEYLKASAGALWPRLREALRAGDLGGVFFAF